MSHLHKPIWVGLSGSTNIQDSTNTNKKQELYEKKLPNSVDTRPVKAEGNTEPSKSVKAPGVCREHGVASKEMICSDLYSNVESIAEMTMPCESRVTISARESGCINSVDTFPGQYHN